MAQPRNEPTPLEQPQRTRLDDIDDHRIPRLPIAQERDHAIRASRGPLHHALITADLHAEERYAGGVTGGGALLDGPRWATPPALAPSRPAPTSTSDSSTESSPPTE